MFYVYEPKIKAQPNVWAARDYEELYKAALAVAAGRLEINKFGGVEEIRNVWAALFPGSRIYDGLPSAKEAIGRKEVCTAGAARLMLLGRQHETRNIICPAYMQTMTGGPQ